jgi:hypothetical protein
MKKKYPANIFIYNILLNNDFNVNKMLLNKINLRIFLLH